MLQLSTFIFSMIYHFGVRAHTIATKRGSKCYEKARNTIFSLRFFDYDGFLRLIFYSKFVGK